MERDYFELLKEDMPGIRRNTRPKMLSEDELKKLFKMFDRELKRKKKLPEFEPDKVQYWFKPVIAVYFYGGLRKHEATYSPDLAYSGLQGENLKYEKGKLSYIELPATKDRDERRVPIIRSLRKYLKVRGPYKDG